MAKSTDKDSLGRWRQAEADYAAAASPFLGEGDAPALKKKTLVELVSLRAKADRWRERYFRQKYDGSA